MAPGMFTSRTLIYFDVAQFQIISCLLKLRPSCRWFIQLLPFAINLSSTSGSQWQQMIFANSIKKEHWLSSSNSKWWSAGMIAALQFRSQGAFWCPDLPGTTKLSWCTSCPSQVWVSEGGCVVWHSAVSFASFLGGKVGGGCDHEEVTRTYFGCSPYTESLVARSICDKWSKTCVFNWMAVINLRLRDLFYFLRIHGAGGSIRVHDHKGVQLAGVVSAMILMVVEGCSAGTAVSWLL